jgi:hypothetical protein
MQQQAENQPFVWRCNLLGGGQLIEIYERLQHLPNISDFIKQKGWEYGEGFIVGEKIEEIKNDKKVVYRTPARFLTGQPMLPLKAFINDKIDKTKIIDNQNELFHTSYTEERYKPPLVLLKKLDSLPIAYWNEFLGYNHSVIGIHAPQAKTSELIEFYNAFKEHHYIYRFFTILNSSAIAGHSTSILKSDIDNLPSTKIISDLKFTFWEKILIEDVVNYMSEYIREGQKSTLLKNSAKSTDFQSYSNTFIRLLRQIYENINVTMPICFDGLACQAFYFGDKPNLPSQAELNAIELRKIIYQDEMYRRLRTVRVLRFYSDNLLLIFKPNRLRYWIRSTAIRDAYDTAIDLYGQGY